MNHHPVLAADALINLALGILLVGLRPTLADFLGVSVTREVFYLDNTRRRST